jgi:xylulokinase
MTFSAPYTPHPTPHTPLLLAIDLGTSSVKVLLVAADGAVVGRGEAAYPILHPQPGQAEQDPAAWWAATCQAVRAAVDLDHAERVAAIGLSGQMHGTVLLNRQGELLAPAVIWPDQRSQAEVQAITAQIGPQALLELTGSPVATGFQSATLAWFRRHRPDLWAAIGQVLLPKDYLRWRLTGRYTSDPSDAAGTLLLDVQRRDWSPVLLAALALDPAWLPPIQPAHSIAGELLPAAANELGLAAGLPVVTGGGDTPCSALGAGALDPSTLLLTLSTGGQLLLPSRRVAVDRQGRIHTFCAALEPGEGRAGWYQMGALLAAGLALRWLRDQCFGLTGADAYTQMTAWAAETPPGAEGLIFLPYLVGERTPHMDPQARALFLGLTLQHERGVLVRAVLEGVTLAAYDAYMVLAELGAAPERIVLAGGGARSPLWRQMVADVFGAPVLPLAVDEQSALGAALLAGAGLGWFDLADTARRWAVCGAPVEPDLSRHAFYQERLSLFRQAYQLNRDLFRELTALRPPARP